MGANPLLGPLEGVGPENRDFFGPWNGHAHERRECHLGPKKPRFSGPTPSNGPSNGFAPIKIINSKCHIKNRYIGNVMCTRSILYSLFCTVCCEFSVIFRAHLFQRSSISPSLPSPPQGQSEATLSLPHRDKVNSLCLGREGRGGKEGSPSPFPLPRTSYRTS